MTDDCLLSEEMPSVLVITDAADQRAPLRSAFEKAGWRVEIATSSAAARVIGGKALVSLILIDDEEDAAGVGTVGAIRQSPGPSAAAPIVRLGAHARQENDPKPSGMDAVLPAQDDSDSLVQRLESWRPLSLASTRRIAAMFGAGPIAGMIERLARRLEAALASLERGTFDKGEAHRLAGLCGTLGFGQAHAAWLDLSLGDQSAIEEVRRTTRLTLAAIDRGL